MYTLKDGGDLSFWQFSLNLFDRFEFFEGREWGDIFYGHHHDLVNLYGKSVSQMIMDMFHLS